MSRSCTCECDICVNPFNVCSQEEYYYAGEMALPIRWCAPETLVCTDSTIETKEVSFFNSIKLMILKLAYFSGNFVSQCLVLWSYFVGSDRVWSFTIYKSNR
jgi:hypothetical protein